MSLIDVHSAATAGIVEALSAAQATRTAILLMVELRKNEIAVRRVTVLQVYVLLHASRSEYGCGCAT
jgi:hypothetical protein